MIRFDEQKKPRSSTESLTNNISNIIEKNNNIKNHTPSICKWCVGEWIANLNVKSESCWKNIQKSFHNACDKNKDFHQRFSKMLCPMYYRTIRTAKGTIVCRNAFAVFNSIAAETIKTNVPCRTRPTAAFIVTVIGVLPVTHRRSATGSFLDFD